MRTSCGWRRPPTPWSSCPTGPSARPPPGLVIPDGSRLQTGNDGHVVAGETELGPKQEAKVRKGTVKPSPTTVPPKPSEPSIPPADGSDGYHRSSGRARPPRRRPDRPRRRPRQRRPRSRRWWHADDQAHDPADRHEADHHVDLGPDQHGGGAEARGPLQGRDGQAPVERLCRQELRRLPRPAGRRPGRAPLPGRRRHHGGGPDHRPLGDRRSWRRSPTRPAGPTGWWPSTANAASSPRARPPNPSRWPNRNRWRWRP